MRKNKVDQVVICLDIGSESVKLIKGMKKEGKICVLDFACRSYPAEDITPSLISRHIGELVSAVVSAKEIRTIKINAIVPSRKLCIRVITLPVIPQEELYQAVKSKIRKYISTDFEKVIFSFCVLGQVQDKDTSKLEVVFVAFPHSVLDTYLQFFDFIRVSPKVITPVCFSGWNLIRETGLHQKLNSLMIINMEHQDTDLTVYREGRLIFTRNIPIGGRNFTDKLKNQTQFSLMNPEDVKLLWDFDAKGSDSQPAEKSSSMKIRSQLQREAELLTREIELTAHHYYQIAHGQRIDKCLILGLVSHIGGLVDFLKKKLEIPVEVLSIPDNKLELPKNKRVESKWDLPLYAQALGGLCIGPNDINLLSQKNPEAKQDKPLFKFSQLSQKAALATIFFISSALIIVTLLVGLNIYYKVQVMAYTVRRDKLQDRSRQLIHMKKKMDRLDFEKNFYIQLIKERPSYPTIIEEIRKAMPDERIVLDVLKFYTDQDKRRSAETSRSIKFNIAGKVMGKDVMETEVTKFMLALEQSGYFGNISVVIKGKVSLQGNVINREQRSRFRNGESSEGELRQLPFVIDGDIQKDRSGRIR